MLNQYFQPTDVDEILKIKPSARLEGDFFAWAREKHGLFTVKSAYGFAMEVKWNASTESSTTAPDGNRKVWDLIWKSDVPPKVQHFAWRLATDSLPTWQNKYRRMLETTSQYPVCGVETEDNFHPFFPLQSSKTILVLHVRTMAIT
jgi:hypothetical protein